jgi:hypothetical protein
VDTSDQFWQLVKESREEYWRSKKTLFYMWDKIEENVWVHVRSQAPPSALHSCLPTSFNLLLEQTHAQYAGRHRCTKMRLTPSATSSKEDDVHVAS